jgi:hypothetical protein
MADRSALGMIGMMLGVVTVLVVSAGAVTVARGVDGAVPAVSPATVITMAAR